MHKKRIHLHPRLIMKYKEKRLEYARQYQIMSAKEWRKVVFSDEPKFKMAFRSTGTQKIFQKRTTQQGITEKDLLLSGWGILIFSKIKICQWSIKSSRLWEDAK